MDFQTNLLDLLAKFQMKLVAVYPYNKLDIYFDTVDRKTTCFIRVFVTGYAPFGKSSSTSYTFDLGIMCLSSYDDLTPEELMEHYNERSRRLVEKEPNGKNIRFLC